MFDSESDSLSLIVDGKEYRAWESVSVQRSMDNLCGSFSLNLAVAEKSGDKFVDSEEFRVKEGDPVILKINGAKYLTGYIDASTITDSGSEGRTISIAGRDKTSDIVDCSAYVLPGSWKQTTLENVAKKLLQPFKLKLKISDAVTLSGSLINFDIETGETVFEALERLTRNETILMNSTADGDMVLIVNKNDILSPIVLKYGVNIKAYNAKFDFSSRYSNYFVVGQPSGDGTKEWVDIIGNIMGDASDNEVDRYRPLVIVAETDSNNETAQKRATWEKVIRKSRSVNIEVVVQGWKQTPTQLWSIGQLIKLDIPGIGIVQNMLINAVNFTKSDEGTEAKLMLVPPDSYMKEPKKVKKNKDTKKDKKGKIVAYRISA